MPADYDDRVNTPFCFLFFSGALLQSDKQIHAATSPQIAGPVILRCWPFPGNWLPGCFWKHVLDVILVTSYHAETLEAALATNVLRKTKPLPWPTLRASSLLTTTAISPSDHLTCGLPYTTAAHFQSFFSSSVPRPGRRGLLKLDLGIYLHRLPPRDYSQHVQAYCSVHRPLVIICFVRLHSPFSCIILCLVLYIRILTYDLVQDCRWPIARITCVLIPNVVPDSVLLEHSSVTCGTT